MSPSTSDRYRCRSHLFGRYPKYSKKINQIKWKNFTCGEFKSFPGKKMSIFGICFQDEKLRASVLLARLKSNAETAHRSSRSGLNYLFYFLASARREYFFFSLFALSYLLG